MVTRLSRERDGAPTPRRALRWRVGAAVLAACATFGCSDDAAGFDGNDAASSSVGPGDTALHAPYLDTVAALHGALHVFWTNETLDCDSIEVERKTTVEPWSVHFDVAGDVEDVSDDAATDPSVVYTYRVRCRRGTEYSAYSNEDSRSPIVQADAP